LRITDHFGFSIEGSLLKGDTERVLAYNLGDLDDLDFEENSWEILFENLKQVLVDSGLNNQCGGLLEVDEACGKFMIHPILTEISTSFQKSFKKYKSDINLVVNYHFSMGIDGLPLSKDFREVFLKDIQYSELFNSKTVIIHFPKRTDDITELLVKEMTSSFVCEELQRTGITLCWENGGVDHYSGSLSNLIHFRENLKDKLNEIGKPNLISQHQFCFDTGHLLQCMHRSKIGRKQMQKDIDTYLPRFAENVKEFHIHGNDGSWDAHIVPGNLKYFKAPSRKNMDLERFLEYSDILLNWLSVCKTNKKIADQHYNIEALRYPLDLGQISEFGKKLGEIIHE
jgi:hypothetical protein